MWVFVFYLLRGPDSNRRLEVMLTNYGFRRSLRFVVWTIPSPSFTGACRLVSTPYPLLYEQRGLARYCHLSFDKEGFTEFDRYSTKHYC